jgi:hypothetical protein
MSGRKPLDRVATFSSCVLVCALAAAAAEASITGVCPDGSIFIVPRAELIPCPDSKQVDPNEVPPLKSEMLPRPYGWEIFNRRNDPNNPYNLIEAGRAVRGELAPPEQSRAGPTTEIQPQVEFEPDRPEARQQATAPTPLPPVSASPPAGAGEGPLELGLGPEEIRDLALIVEYSQQRAPAAIARGDDGDPPGLVVRLAQSRSFEARLRDAALRSGRAVRGPVVLFSAVGGNDEDFYANLTFVQGHMAFHPEREQPGELGLIEGRLGRLSGDEVVLGYVVLPEHMDLSQPMDIYWNDRQITATLRP